MKRRHLRVQGYRGPYSHCPDSTTTPELTSHIKHFTFKLFKVGHLNLKCYHLCVCFISCVLVLCSACGGLGLTLRQIISPPQETYFYFINTVFFFFFNLSAAASCSLAAVKTLLRYTLHHSVLNRDRVTVKRGTLLFKSYAITLRTHRKMLSRVLKKCS